MRYIVQVVRFLLFSVALVQAGIGMEIPPCYEVVYTTHPPVIDGILKPEEWSAAAPLFLSIGWPKAQVMLSTCGEARLLWTPEGLYCSWEVVDNTLVFGHAPSGMPLYKEDVFELFIDSVGDHRQYYEIELDPAGHAYFKNTILTAKPRLTNEFRLEEDFVKSNLWSYVIPAPDGFRIASKVNPTTHLWTLEVFLPASFINRRLNGKPLAPTTMRFNLARHDWDLPLDSPNRKVKFYYYSPVLPGNPHISPTLMGNLVLKKP